MPQIIIHRGGVFQREFAFSGEEYVVVGRASGTDIQLSDASRRVSRYHAAIVRAASGDGRYFLRDLGSLHSTRVSGQPVRQYVLREGDVIEIGGYQLKYSVKEQPVADLSPLRVVARRVDKAGVGDTTAYFSAHEMLPEVSDAQREVVESVMQAARNGTEPAGIFAQLLEPVLQVTGAMRGFAARLLPDGGRVEVTGRSGMRPGDQIEITDPDYMDSLTRGQPVLDGHILLAPIRDGESTVGFLCLERPHSEGVFLPADAEFLQMLGQLAMGLQRTAAPRPTGAAGVLSWPVEMVGRSERMQDLRRQIQDAASSDANVLVLGESGTGKELVARAIHTGSAYAAGPFVARNCAAITESLAEAEIFGYAKKSGISGADPEGAPGWFEMANGGTLFLDEIQGLSAALQDKFLRVLQEKQVWRVRARAATPVSLKIVAATDKDLNRAMEEGWFRRPFFFRFAKMVHLPPLRDRKEDVPLLTFYFLDRYSSKLGCPPFQVSHRAMLRLQDFEWPGNVRQLEHCLESAASQAQGRDVLFSWDFDSTLGESLVGAAPDAVAGGANEDAPVAMPPAEARQPLSMTEVEKAKIMEALEVTEGNISKAVKLLGYKSRQTLLNKMDRYGIPRQYGDADQG